MTAIGQVLYLILFVFSLLLIGRIVIDYVRLFARDWRPKGLTLLLLEGVYSVTDPPVRALRRVIPPLRIGGVALDLSILVLFLLLAIAMRLVVLL
ncbi:MAG TPA: YggT family protein [Actinobacteria bacterium]|nr:YggT family protein [Actinomycetota bacterium]